MRVCVVGGAGYVGTTLVPRLLKRHDVTVLDSFWFGDHLSDHPKLIKIKGDIRNKSVLDKAFTKQDAVIHLACVSNDPSFDLNPKLGRDINYTCFKPMLLALNQAEVNRFVYASSSSVYGVKEGIKVTEDVPCDPLTDYSKYKLSCELELKSFGTGGAWTIVRPATVCGYSPRMRFDLIVNILARDAIKTKRITVHGGFQLRPNIHVKDMAKAYEFILDAPEKKVNEKTYNVGANNYSLEQIAFSVRAALSDDKIEIIREESKDPRSYHICSDLIKNDLNFIPERTITGAVHSIRDAIDFGLLKDILTNTDYVNIARMNELKL